MVKIAEDLVNMQKEYLKNLGERILTYYNEAEKILNGEISLPRMAVFHLTYVCNHNCEGCEYRELNSKSHEFLTKEQIFRILDELNKNGVRGIEISGGGEPLIHPNMNDLILKLHEKDMSIGLLTNGSLLKGEVLKNMIKYGSHIRVSLESGSKKVFEKVKCVNGEEFDKIINNLKEAVRLRKELNSNIELGIKFTVGTNNYQDMENAIKLAIDLDVDYINFKLYTNVNVDLENSKEKLKEAQKMLSGLKERYKDKMLILGSLIPKKSKMKCWLSPIQVTVDALGDAYICPSYRVRKKTHYIGNILKEDFKDIWFSEKHKEGIARIKRENCDIYECRFHVYNEIMDKLMKDKAETDFI